MKNAKQWSMCNCYNATWDHLYQVVGQILPTILQSHLNSYSGSYSCPGDCS